MLIVNITVKNLGNLINCLGCKGSYSVNYVQSTVTTFLKTRMKKIHRYTLRGKKIIKLINECFRKN